CYIDIVLCLMITAAALALARGLRPEAERRWLVLAAIFLGVACGTKYTALIFALAMAAALVFGLRRRALGPLLQLGAIVALVGGYWYLRGYLYSGNPVWP